MVDATNDLEIHYARYGPISHNRNVIDCVDELISPNDRLSALVSNDNLGGDFYPGYEKQLHIIYTFNGLLYEEKLGEGELLTIPRQSNIPDNALLESVSFGLGVVALSWGISRVVRAWRFGE